MAGLPILALVTSSLGLPVANTAHFSGLFAGGVVGTAWWIGGPFVGLGVSGGLTAAALYISTHPVWNHR